MAKRDLLEVYLGNDYRRLQMDLAERPTHYSAAQREALELLMQGRDVDRNQRAELLMQYMRRSEPVRLERKIKQQMSMEPMKNVKPPSFEDQDLFKGVIKII